MPKVGKSHSGAKKRFKKTGKGKLMFLRGWRNHLLTNKGRNKKTKLDYKELEGGYKKTVKTLIKK